MVYSVFQWDYLAKRIPPKVGDCKERQKGEDNHIEGKFYIEEDEGDGQKILHTMTLFHEYNKNCE